MFQRQINISIDLTPASYSSVDGLLVDPVF